MMNLLLILAGLALLTLGGEALIRGALSAARKLGLSTLLAGIIIVGFGTSAPELVVSLDAALSGRPDIAVGNAVGSNISNILLILGLSALITPLTFTPAALHRDGVYMLFAAFIYVVLAYNGILSRWDGLFLFTLLLFYLFWVYRTEKQSHHPSALMHASAADELTLVPKSLAVTGVWIATGLVLLIAGSRLLVTGAVNTAQLWGVSEAVIGLTLVAVGTSLPELAVCVVAALRKHGDVAVGNILGSNIFNVLGILGLSGLIRPLPVHERITNVDQWVLVGATAAILLLLYTGRRLIRLEGGLLLAVYVGYIGFNLSG